MLCGYLVFIIHDWLLNSINCKLHSTCLTKSLTAYQRGLAGTKYNHYCIIHCHWWSLCADVPWGGSLQFIIVIFALVLQALIIIISCLTMFLALMYRKTVNQSINQRSNTFICHVVHIILWHQYNKYLHCRKFWKDIFTSHSQFH